jgi:hypothetical protein
MPVFLPSKTINLKLGAGSSSFPDNFQIDIWSWNVTTDAAEFNRTYATGITKTQLATAGVGYNVTGITGNDYKVVATSTGTCTTLDDVEVYVDALSIYQPSFSGTFTDIYNGYPTTPQVNTFTQTGTGSGEDSFAVTGPYGGLQNITGNHVVGIFDTLSYIDATDFTLSYVSGTSGGVTVYDDYANGPFSSFSITKSGKSFTLIGSSNTSLAPQNFVPFIKGTMRLTYDPSTYYVDFDYWYNPTNI